MGGNEISRPDLFGGFIFAVLSAFSFFFLFRRKADAAAAAAAEQRSDGVPRERERETPSLSRSLDRDFILSSAIAGE